MGIPDMEKAVVQPNKCGKGIFTPAAIKAGLAVCWTKVPWGYFVAAYTKGAIPGEPTGEPLWQISSAEEGPIYATAEPSVLSGALRALNRRMRQAGITHARKRQFLYVGKVWLY